MANDNSANKNKTVIIIVNGREHEVQKAKLTFEEIVSLGLGECNSASNIAYTVSYSKGEDKKPKGIMARSDSVMIKDGMIFNVTRTDKS